jgi:hypothetical protein
MEKIAGLKGLRLTIGAWGAWCGLAPDDSPLILREATTFPLAPELLCKTFSISACSAASIFLFASSTLLPQTVTDSSQ